MTHKVAILMGSASDRDKMAPAADTLARYGVEADVRLCPCDESWWFIPDRAAPGDEAVAVTADWFLAHSGAPGFSA